MKKKPAPPPPKPKKPQRPPCEGSKAPAPDLAAWKSTCPVCKRLLKLRGSTTGDGLCFPRHCPPAPKPEKVIPDVSNTLCRKRLKGNAPGVCGQRPAASGLRTLSENEARVVSMIGIMGALLTISREIDEA